MATAISYCTPRPANLSKALGCDLCRQAAARRSTIVMQCLERDRAKRFQNAQELERALNRYVVTNERFEDTDVAFWMRKLFPVESAETETASSLRPPLRAGRIFEGTTLVPLPPSQVETRPPDASASSVGREVFIGVSDVSANDPSGELPTARSPLSSQLTRRRFLAVSVVASLVGFAIVVRLLVEKTAELRGAPTSEKRTAETARATLEEQPKDNGVASSSPESPMGVRLDVPVDAPSSGPSDAKVTLIEWSDFQCRFCSRAATTLEKLREIYDKDLRVVFRNLPLPMHPNARIAAQAAMAAHAQGKFWPMHDRLFADQSALDRESLDQTAEQLGLDMPRFQNDFNSMGTKTRIDTDIAAAQAEGVHGTPSYFVNGRPLAGALPLEQFKLEIDRELTRANKLLAQGVKRKSLYRQLVADASQ